MLHFNHKNWELEIRAIGNIEKKCEAMSRLYNKRGLDFGRLGKDVILDASVQCELPEKLSKPFFLENQEYLFEWSFDKEVTGFPRVEHSLKRIEETFTYDTKSKKLRGTLRTGNHIGWVKLEIAYSTKDGTFTSQILEFFVHPIKITVKQDLVRMCQEIDDSYPLWRFEFASLSTINTGHSKESKDNSSSILMWLSNFEQMFREYKRSVRILLNGPHTNLVRIHKVAKPDSIKRRLPCVQEEKLKSALQGRNYAQKFPITSSILTVDTPENRFVKHTLVVAQRQLRRLLESISVLSIEAPGRMVSSSVTRKIMGWLDELASFLNLPIFKSIPAAPLANSQSLVLQQKDGYRKIFSIWREWKKYLDLFDGELSIGFKPVSEIYEMWCFLQVQLICMGLGFEKVSNWSFNIRDSELSPNVEGGFSKAITFSHSNGCVVRIAHEPIFRFGENLKGYFSLSLPQKPDIVIEIQAPNEAPSLWVLDAKYRVSSGNFNNGMDLVPDDAINQIHRYRDSIFWSDGENTLRPVIGGCALYPGFYDQTADRNPYMKWINACEVGALALFPDDNGNGINWLKTYLKDRINQQHHMCSFK
ncbi:MAG: DUF2357 domain-containing protein [Corynebacterium sp.]|uniref:DUF2357 domain-containing protein n=1 Tax=Corynebacterium sp. TaxID=1720 RepID=UPI0026DC17BD|nr:DUF2357 domain-containing protein [Corynebacterium sp.]MDO4762222.1 DUF2357 domain-containing protein [Corynebacterium sp.]